MRMNSRRLRISWRINERVCMTMTNIPVVLFDTRVKEAFGELGETLA